MFVVAVDAGAFFLGQIHCREAVDAVADAAIVAGVGALDHEIGRDKAALPGLACGLGNALPAHTVCAGDGTGLHMVAQLKLDIVILDDLADVLKGGFYAVLGIEAAV